MRGAQRDELEDFAEELVNMMDATQAARDLGIAQALRRLRAEDLTILTMSLFGEMSHREITETLGLPAGTVKSRLHRTVKALRQLPNPEVRAVHNRGES